MKKFIVSLTTIALLSVSFGSVPQAFAQHCTVKHGDSMWKIAERYNVLFKEVLELNKHHIDPDLIHPQDKVHLPDGSEGQTTSEPQKGHSEPQTATGDKTSTQAEEVLKLVNSERQKAGLNALTLSDKLTSIANTKAKDMADKNYFSHTSPTYGSPFDMLHTFGVSYSSAGENIAAGQKTAEQVMTDWMNSSGHRANILNKNYTELGVGYVQGGSYGTEWVQLFIRP